MIDNPESTIIQPDSDIEKRGREALNWLVALREEDDDGSLLRQFLAWKTACPENEQAWQDAQRVWNLLGAAPASNIEARSEDRSNRSSSSPVKRASLSPSSRLFPLRRPALAAACFAVLACIFILSAPATSLWLGADYRTGIGQIQQVRLDDGSVVTLGADSAISLSFGHGRRGVKLLAGEAFFDVEHDRDHPFTVEAKGVETTVLGTRFNVRMGGDGVAVAVANGRVLVDCPSCAKRQAGPPLEAGEWQRVAWEGTVERGKTSPSAIGAWLSGMLVVDDVAVGDMVDTLERYYRCRIIVAVPGFRAKRVTGVYDLSDPMTALRAVAEAQGAKVHVAGSWLAVVSNR